MSNARLDDLGCNGGNQVQEVHPEHEHPGGQGNEKQGTDDNVPVLEFVADEADDYNCRESRSRTFSTTSLMVQFDFTR